MFEAVQDIKAAYWKVAGSNELMRVNFRWFQPENCLPDLIEWGKAYAAATPKRHHVIDVFGASQRVTSTWLKAGMRAKAFDIKLCPQEDLCSKAGFMCLLQLGLTFLANI